MEADDKRSEKRDPGEAEQNAAIAKGLADKPEEAVDAGSKCPTCGKDTTQTS